MIYVKEMIYAVSKEGNLNLTGLQVSRAAPLCAQPSEPGPGCNHTLDSADWLIPLEIPQGQGQAGGAGATLALSHARLSVLLLFIAASGG